MGLPGEAVPRLNGELLFPLLSIHAPELPFVPPFLRGFEYWTVFVEPDAWEQTLEEGSLVIRRYPSARTLQPLRELADEDEWPVWDLAFTEVQDHPSWQALRRVLAERGDVATNDAELQLLAKRFRCHSGLKLGGYPHLIQETAFLQTLEPDFQIQVDVSDAYRYGDSGIGYLYSGLTAMIWESM